MTMPSTTPERGILPEEYLNEVREALREQVSYANTADCGSDGENYHLIMSQTLATFYLAEVTRYKQD